MVSALEPRTDRRISVAGPSITDVEIDAVTAAVRSGWYENANDVVHDFEVAFARHVGRRHAVSLPSATSGLHLALAGLGIGPGDEVVVPDATWIATAAPISYVGATPVFADVDPITWCLDTDSFRRAITSKTRAVITVDLYGGTPDYAALAEICTPAGIHIIEDAAQAIGSRRDGQAAGAFGTAGVFSFHGAKTLTTGEGGMLVLDDDALFARVSILRDHGRHPGDVSFQNHEVAFKYKMSSLQAALGHAQLSRLHELVDGKRQIFDWYRDRLGNDDRLTLNAEPESTYNSYWMSTVIFDGALGLTKERVGACLAAEGVDNRPFFSPLSSLEAYANLPEAASARDANGVSRRLGSLGLNLPSALRLTEDEVDRACTALVRILDGRA
ncbi:MAG: perosamine synthetase [Acidimicrobiaceae bacterium]|jgi:perosamine synthetase|nr:perosamine synthetase [Acidimicrobiaceae bacterium]